MTSSTFDGASTAAHRGDPLAGLDRSEQAGPPVAEDFSPPTAHTGSSSNGGGEGSALDMLRERVEQREAAPVEMWVKELPKIGIRLTCDPRVPNSEFQRWMRASRPKKQGRGAQQTDGMDLDQLGFSCRALAATNIMIEVNKRFGKGGEPVWEALRDGEGDHLTVEHQEVWRLFSVHRADVLLVKLFGRDPLVIDAGQEFLGAAGYMGDGDDESDPLG